MSYNKEREFELTLNTVESYEMGDDFEDLDISEIDADEMDEDDDEKEADEASRPRKKARN